jgi:hypothetical protein
MLRRNLTVPSDLHCYVQKQAQLVGPLSVITCTVFLESLSKGSTATYVIYFLSSALLASFICFILCASLIRIIT